MAPKGRPQIGITTVASDTDVFRDGLACWILGCAEEFYFAVSVLSQLCNIVLQHLGGREGHVHVEKIVLGLHERVEPNLQVRSTYARRRTKFLEKSGEISFQIGRDSRQAASVNVLFPARVLFLERSDGDRNRNFAGPA